MNLVYLSDSIQTYSMVSSMGFIRSDTMVESWITTLKRELNFCYRLQDAIQLQHQVFDNIKESCNTKWLHSVLI